MLKDSLLSSEKFNSLNYFEQSLYIRLILLVDDFGRYDGREQMIKSSAFPMDEKVTKKSIAEAISKMVNVDLLHRYVASGKPYICFPRWESYQRLRSKTSKYPEPTEENTEIMHDSHMTVICQSCDSHMSARREEKRREVEEEAEENDSSERSTATEPPVISLPLIDKTFRDITQKEVDHFQELYPNVDIMQELRNMVGWLESNPTRKKTRSGVNKFMNTWLAKEQDKGTSNYSGNKYLRKVEMPQYDTSNDATEPTEEALSEVRELMKGLHK